MPVIKSPQDLDYDYLEKLYENKIFEDYTPNEIRSRKYEGIKVSNDKLTFKLIDKEQRDLISLIHGEFNLYYETEYFEVVWTYSKSPRQGHLTYLFELLIYEFDYVILSDKYHTSPGSKEFWQSLINKNTFKIFRLDITSNYKRRANRYNENQIWGKEDESGYLNELDNLIFLEDNLNEEYESEYISEVIGSFEKNFNSSDLYGKIKNPNNRENTSKEKIRLVAQR